MSNPITTESYDYYFLAPYFYGRVDEGNLFEIFNFNTSSWIPANPTLSRRIQTDGDSISKDKVAQIISNSKLFAKL